MDIGNFIAGSDAGMRFVSTRDASRSWSIREALKQGIVPDGGLFIPEQFPQFSSRHFDGASEITDVAVKLLEPFFADDPDLARELPEICRNTLSFPIPLHAVPGRERDFILELYHGPTAAFKDVGARFLAACMETLIRVEKRSSPLSVIVATSGDTGGAVAGAFHGRVGIDVNILFPKGRISPRQEKQLCAWGGNVRAFAVEGTFDDCQRIVKQALLARPWLSANSINLGRILPQMIYYAWASLSRFRETGAAPNFIIPSGNLGNSVAALWAKKMGLPIGVVHLAHNANHAVADFLKTGVFRPEPTIPTLANAMDVGAPSNIERMQSLYPSVDDLRRDVQATCASDSEIEAIIRTSERDWGQVLCPHTATAAYARRLQPDDQREWILVSTAHAAKFETIVEPLIGHEVPLPVALQQILEQPSKSETIAPQLPAFFAALD